MNLRSQESIPALPVSLANLHMQLVCHADLRHRALTPALQIYCCEIAINGCFSSPVVRHHTCALVN